MSTQGQKLDRLAKVLKGISSDRLRDVLVKEATLTIRLTASEKADMQRVAKACGLTLTDYLTRLHLFASQRLFAENKTTQKGH